MNTVTKEDLARHTAQQLNENINTTAKIVDGLFGSLRQIIIEARDEVRIEIRGLGVFEVKKTNPKPNARNPMTGETVYVPARKKVRFRAGKLLQEVLKKPLE